MNKKIIVIYSSIHFIVDLACAILIGNLVTQKMYSNTNLFMAIFIYNFFAFAMQLPIGIIADKINKNAICSAIGCLLVAIAFGFLNFAVIACLIAGIGNAMFHVSGGIEILNISNKKAALSGIFVSTGAMGIFLGGKSALIGFSKYYMVVLILFISVITLLYLYCKVKDKVNNEKVIIPTINRNKMIVIVSLIITVVIRGYVGLILSFEWKSNFMLALIFVLAVVLGKMLGGIIGDKIGFTKTSLLSLIVSAFLFIFAFKSSIFGILAVLFFNMTMPITLTAVSNILFNNKGMAFGLLTVALFIGAVPIFFGYKDIIFNPIGLFTTTIISAVVLYIGIKKYMVIMEKKI